ncbi:alpha/beta fold hydrolase [Nocardia cyriacigeorgica]|uniref:alpha/beta fold hydrolase n=1 Tax=Nocardia cyriacigeorgica TaxID=135487 RepID=UPI0018942657|nr:alpha/beta hydrolase [Nocardia cyriacigeorgica]MBF6325883.1 alpha/beta hydrolase [Nocardia cyriacigeorgica]
MIMDQNSFPSPLPDGDIASRSSATTRSSGRQPDRALDDQRLRRPASGGFPPTRRIKVAASDGTHLSAALAGTDDPAATVIYLHGPLTDDSIWTPLISVLHQSLGPTIAHLTYRHHAHRHTAGQTNTAETAAAPVPVRVDDVDAIVAALHGPMVAVAHSGAASTLLAWAAQARSGLELMTGFVLFNPIPELPNACGSHHDASGLPEIHHMGSHPKPRIARTARKPVHDGGSRRPSIGNPGQPARAMSRACHQEIELTEAALEVLRSIPTWVVAGGRDSIVSPGHARVLAERLWADFSVISTAGHEMPATEPAACSTAVLDALDVAYRAQLYGAEC